MAWYDSNWQFRKEVTVDNTQVDATLSNFPLYVRIAGDSDLASNAQSSGNDILFTESDGSTKLDHEIQSFDGANGDLHAHVEIMSLSSSSDTTLYMYYGNSGASDQQNVAGTWDSEYVGVWHLHQSASGTGNTDVYDDATSNNNHGDDFVSDTNKDGKVGPGQGFDGADDYIVVPHSAELDLTTFSISVWFRTSVTSDGGIVTITNKEDPSDQFSNRNWWLAIDNGQGFAGGDGFLGLRTSSGGTTVSVDATDQDYRDGEWHHAFCIFDPPNDNAEIWTDGVQRSTQSGVGTPDTQTSDMTIGCENATSLPYRPWQGNIDAHLLYSSAKPDGYITTIYNNQGTPGTFYTVGSQETAGPTTQVLSENILLAGRQK